MSSSKKHTGKLKAVVIAVCTLLVFGLAVKAGIYMEKNTRITEVNFTGNSFTTDDELHASFESPVGMLADSVHLPGLYEKITELPYVQSVSASMASRGRLTFNIFERQPIALMINGENRFFVDKDGITLPLILGHDVDVPLLYGFRASSVADTLNSEAFEQVSSFLAEAKNKPFSWLTISEVTWNEREGVVALSTENGVKLIFGNDEFDRKLTHWEAFYKQVATHKGIRSFRSVDLRFSNQIIADKI